MGDDTWSFKKAQSAKTFHMYPVGWHKCSLFGESASTRSLENQNQKKN